MTLPSVLDPYSVWVLSHRNTVIVVLGLILFAVACHSLIMHWRVESLERDLSSVPERSDRTPVYTPSRPMGAPQPDPEPPQPGGLPPVRGGRTYARNLGSALQKSSAPPAPPIYSPPTPAGWSPNAAAQQPGRPPASPFPSGPAPWGAPVPPPPMGWPPMGPGMTPATPPLSTYPNQPGGPPAPPGPPPAWPGFAPPQPQVGGMPSSAPPNAPGQPGPTPFGAPALPGVPAFGQAASPAAVPAQGAPAAPGPGPYPTLQAAPVEAPAPEMGKRGKPKRRRFNFSVLEGIEKKIQSLPSSLPRAAAPVETPAVPAPAPAGAATPPAPVAPAPVLAPEITPAESETPPTDAVRPAGDDAKAAVADSEAAEPSAPDQRARSKSGREPRSAMRSMMFGEEPPAPAPPAATTAEEPETAVPAGEPALAADAFPFTSNLPPVSEPIGGERAAEESTFAFTSRPDDSDAAAAGPPVVVESQPQMSFDSAPSLASDTGDSPSWATPGGGEALSEEPAHDLGQASSIQPEPSTAAEPEAGVTEEVDRPAYQLEPEPAGAPVSAETTEAAGEPPSTPADEQTPAAGTVVIIEDDTSVAEYYATLFRGNGYRVEVAHDGVSGVDLCAKVQPDVILLDVMMPRQNGILVLQTLRASDETRNTPVVVLSNFSEPTLIKRALQLGALEYVIKTQVEGGALLLAMPRWMSHEKAFAAA